MGASGRKAKPKVQVEKPSFDYQNGFWLDNNIFIKADNAEIKLVEKKKLSVYGETKEDKMVIFANAVEIWVDEDDKIVGVTNHPKFALWLDAINNDALQKIEKKNLYMCEKA